MDVNGYMHKLNETILAADPNDKHHIQQVKTITLKGMAEEFKTHPSWNDLQNEDSELVRFLKDNFTEKGDDDCLCVVKLRNIGILWC